MPLPNFFIIGAAKCGTTSLAAYIQQHPDVFIPRIKEPNYFALLGHPMPKIGPVPAKVLQHLLYNLSTTNLEEYLDLFQGVSEEKAIGEASVRYIYFERAAQNIASKISDAKIIAILRNPVDRVYSHFNMNVQLQLEPLDLISALEAEPKRIAQGWGWDWHYAAMSRYAPQIARYIETFGRENVLILLYDDFLNDPLSVVRAIYRHIGVDDEFVPKMDWRGMVPYRPRNLLLDRLIHWPNPVRSIFRRLQILEPVAAQVQAWNARPVPKLSPELREELAPMFMDDIAKLSDLLERNPISLDHIRRL